jgi:hypothetical protein
VSSIVFFVILTVAFIGLLVLTARQLGRARSWAPGVASSVRASETTLQRRRAVMVVCSLIAVGGLIASIHAHDTETWTDGEVLGVAKDAAESLHDADSVSSPAMSVNAAVDAAMRDADGPGLLTTEPATAQDDADDEGTDGDTYDDEEGSDSSYVISDHGRHAACLTVTSTAGGGILVPTPGGDESASSIDTYDLSATATAGTC